MRPTLPTAASRIAFAAGTGLALLLPLVVYRDAGSRHLLAVPERWASVGHLRAATPEGGGDLDVLFLGSSLLDAGIDLPAVQERFSESLGRPARIDAQIITGYSLLVPYALLKEELKHRRVRLAVVAHFADDPGAPTGHEAISHYLWNPVEDGAVFDGEPLAVRAGFYALGMLGAPRRLLGIVRPDQRMGLSYAQELIAANRACELGGALRRGGFSDSQGGAAPHADFVDYQPPPIPVDPRATFYCGPGSNPAFREGRAAPGPDVDLLRALKDLAAAHGTRLVFLGMPGLFSDAARLESQVEVFGLPPDLYREGLRGQSANANDRLAFIGVPESVLYQGLTLDEVKRLYSDCRHLNRNGARHYTRAITPALLAAHRGDDLGWCRSGDRR